jgi:uncharacterized phage protein (TIGR02220 family)
MELIKFIRELRKKGQEYYDVWMLILFQIQDCESQQIKLMKPIDMPRSSYHRIIETGLKLLSNNVSTLSFKKDRNHLIVDAVITEIKVATESIIESVEPETKSKPKPKKVVEDKTEIYEEIISYLNQCTGKSYKVTSKIAITNINARLKEGYQVEDFKKVIYVKSNKWLGTKMEDYLTPNTLFGNKMESYLNETLNVQNKQTEAYDTAIKATELGWNKPS